MVTLPLHAEHIPFSADQLNVLARHPAPTYEAIGRLGLIAPVINVAKGWHAAIHQGVRRVRSCNAVRDPPTNPVPIQGARSVVEGVDGYQLPSVPSVS